MHSNFDPQELAKFSAMAAHWWDPHGDVKTLHQINPLRLSYIKQKVNLAGKSVLDIGCGGGILSESMQSENANVTGIDMNKSLLEVAKLHQYESGTKVNYLHTSAEKHATENPEVYDVVTCLEMLEHVPDPAAIVQACAKLVKPHGHLFFSTLNRNPKAYLFAIIGAEYILNLLPKNTHDYAKFIRPSELGKWLSANHVNLQELKGISYQPFTQQFSLSDDISVNYLCYATKST